MNAKSIENTFIYRHLNSKDAVATAVGSVIGRAITLGQVNLEEPLLTIRKNYKYPLKMRVLEALERGDVILVYSPPNVRLPSSLPFFLTRKDGKIVAIVAVDMFGKMDESNGNVAIDAKKLYTLIEAAMISREYYMTPEKFVRRAQVIGSGSAIYSGMVTRVLNKRYALNVDKNRMHKVIFAASKFFMINILGMENGETVNNYAMRNVPNANPIAIKTFDASLSETNEPFESLDKFILALADGQKLDLGLSDLTVRGYLEAFIVMYDAASLLALEHFSYFMLNVNSVIHGAYMNQQFAFEDFTDRDGPKLYNEIAISLRA